MSASVSFTNAEAFQDYIRDYAPQLIGKLFHGFNTGNLITPLEGVKGQMVLTENTLGTLVQRWAKTFDPTADAIGFNPRTLRTYPAKVDLQIYPQEFESSYLGMSRKPGFQPDDMPFEAYVLDRVIAKVQAEKETAIWQGVEDATPDAGDALIEIFDGFLQIIVEELVLGTITAVTTAAHSTTNAVGNAELVHAGLAPQYQTEETYMFCSVAFARMYNQNYRTDFGKYVGTEKRNGMDMIRLDFGNCWLVPTVGMGTSSRLICTPASNLYYGYDVAMDDKFIRVEQNHRSLDFMIDFKIGCQIGIVHDDILRVNNLT